MRMTNNDKAKTPISLRQRIANLTDIDLLKEYSMKCTTLLEPYLFTEIKNRRLLPTGFYYKDVVELICLMESESANEDNDKT